MMYDDVWWCMYDDVWWCIYDVYMMYIWCIYDDVWWCMMMYDGVLFLPWNMRMSASVYCQRDPKGNFGLTGLPRQWGHPPGAALETEKLTKSLMATGSLHTSTRSARIYLSCLVLNNPSLGLQIGSHVRFPGNQRKSDDLDLLSFIVACIPFLPATLRFFYRAYAYIKEKWQPKLSPVDGPFQQQSFPTWMSISY